MRVVFRNKLFKLMLIGFISLSSIVRVDSAQNFEWIEHFEQKIQITYLSDLKNDEQKQINSWLQGVSAALRTVYGEWPKDRFDIHIQRNANSRGPVPWGQVSRGNPNKVLLVVNPDYGLARMSKDWTAYHELSHLLIPYRGYGDLWFSEGLASYYQNVIQARSGLLSETAFWQKLLHGFDRGRQQNNWSQVKLTKLSSNMRRYRNYMRVHWSGVHFWLSADVKLRQLNNNKSNNTKSLDFLLKALKDCCQNRKMSASAIVDKLDQLSATNIFKTQFKKYRNSYAMPNYLPILTDLGVTVGDDADVKELKPDAVNSRVRKNIYNGELK